MYSSFDRFNLIEIYNIDRLFAFHIIVYKLIVTRERTPLKLYTFFSNLVIIYILGKLMRFSQRIYKKIHFFFYYIMVVN